MCTSHDPVHCFNHTTTTTKATTGDKTTVEIAPGVEMPLVNLGGVTSRPSNYSLWLSPEVKGRGIDTGAWLKPGVFSSSSCSAVVHNCIK